MDTITPTIPSTALARDLVAILYVGAKKQALDNVARSGKLWNGKGDVQEVTPSQAKILMLYPDQWVPASGLPPVIVTPQLPVPGSGGETVAADELEGKRLEKMKPAELKAYALARFGKTLAKGMNATGMRNEIEEYENTVEPLPGSVKAAR